MTEADKRFGNTLRNRVLGESPTEGGVVPPELIERVGAAMGELQSVLEELAALGAEEEAAEKGAGA
jgi:hypothetical protein